MEVSHPQEHRLAPDRRERVDEVEAGTCDRAGVPTEEDQHTRVVRRNDDEPGRCGKTQNGDDSAHDGRGWAKGEQDAGHRQRGDERRDAQPTRLPARPKLLAGLKRLKGG